MIFSSKQCPFCRIGLYYFCTVPGEMIPLRKRQVNSSSIEAPELSSIETMNQKDDVPEVDTPNEVKDSPGEDVDVDVVDVDAQ